MTVTRYTGFGRTMRSMRLATLLVLAMSLLPVAAAADVAVADDVPPTSDPASDPTSDQATGEEPLGDDSDPPGGDPGGGDSDLDDGDPDDGDPHDGDGPDDTGDELDDDPGTELDVAPGTEPGPEVEPGVAETFDAVGSEPGAGIDPDEELLSDELPGELGDGLGAAVFAASAPAQYGAVVVLVTAGDPNGPPVAGVCVDLVSSQLGMWQGRGCTDADGQVRVEGWVALGAPRLHYVEVDTPPGYLPVERVAVMLAPGLDSGVPIVLTASPPRTEIFRSVDDATGNPLGGACWQYRDPTTQTPTSELRCDEDGDGEVVFDDVPVVATCTVVTPPDGYAVVGSPSSCTGAVAAGRTVTKAFAAGAGVGDARIVLTALAWGEPVADVCIALVVERGSAWFEAGEGCTGAEGSVEIAGLAAGSYELVVVSVPAGYPTFAVAPFTITGGGVGSTTVDITPTAGSGTDAVLTALLHGGPQTVPGACWRLARNDGGVPGPTLIGPICDTDGDGLVTMSGVATGALCLVVSPPPGYFRPDGRYSWCEQAVGVHLRLSLGLAPAPPAPPPTPPPAPPPVADEPSGRVAVQNCAEQVLDFDRWELFRLCTPVPAGVRLAVVQGGAPVAEVVTDAAGTVAVDLDERRPYRLEYRSGNDDSSWVPAPGQESLQRYGSSQLFVFTRPPEVDRDWQMTVRIRVRNSGIGAEVVAGGACAELRDADGALLLAEQCDDDGDGWIVLGTLPPRPNNGANPYRAVLTRRPTGYEDIAPGSDVGIGGTYEVAEPNRWVATFEFPRNSLRINVVDTAGNPVPGVCINNVNGPVHCNDPSAAPDGRIVIRHVGAATYHWAMWSTVPGYLLNTATFATTMQSSPWTDVTLVLQPDPDSGGPADVHVQLVPPDAGWSPGQPLQNYAKPCFTLVPVAPSAGPTRGPRCSSNLGQLVFLAVDPGSYELRLHSRDACVRLLTAAQQRPFEVAAATPLSFGAGDVADGVIRLDVPVAGCDPVPDGIGTCLYDERIPGRSIDIYYGALTGLDAAVLASPLQLSETIPEWFADELVDAAGHPELTLARLAPWLEPQYDSLVSLRWPGLPDWDGDAHAGMLAAFAESGRPFLVGERIDRGTVELVWGFRLDVHVVHPTERDRYPECITRDPDWQGGTATVLREFVNTVHLYELNAVVAPDGVPPAEPVCSTFAERDLVVAYARHPESGELLLVAGEPIPAALGEALVAVTPSADVGAALAAWIDPGLDAVDWAHGPAPAVDPVATLGDQLRAQGLLPGAAVSERSASYAVQQLREERELPPGCTAPEPGVAEALAAEGMDGIIAFADLALPEPNDPQRAYWSRILAVEQSTAVNVRFVDLTPAGGEQPGDPDVPPASVPPDSPAPEEQPDGQPPDEQQPDGQPAPDAAADETAPLTLPATR